MARKKSNYGGVHTLSLPSGKKIKVRRPSLLYLVTSGGFPAELTMKVWQTLQGPAEELPDLLNDPKALTSWATIINSYIPNVMVDPKIGEPTNLEEEDDGTLSGTLSLADMRDADRQFVFLYGTGVYKGDEEMITAQVEKEIKVADLVNFRDESVRPDAGRGGEEVRSEAVVVGGDSS